MPDTANVGAIETGLVAAIAPCKLLTVNRRLLLDTKSLIKSRESCETESELDFKSRQFNFLKSDNKIFRSSVSELRMSNSINFLCEIADKFEKYVSVIENRNTWISGNSFFLYDVIQSYIELFYSFGALSCILFSVPCIRKSLDQLLVVVHIII